MSEFKVTVKKEPDGVVKGSLGALLTSYGSGSDESSSDDEETERPEVTTKQSNQERLPNPFFSQAPSLVSNPLHQAKSPQNGGTASLVRQSGSSEEIKIKEEVNPEIKVTDFAKLCAKGAENGGERKEVDMTLDDFMDYNAARPIKLEVASDTSESESESESTVSEERDAEDRLDKANKKLDGPKVKGELGLDDLPPIEDLHISVPRAETKPIGTIKSVVEPLVLVEAYLDTPALDLDSVLFLDQGDRALGRIHDVIGPVKQPVYCVRFNSKEHIEKNKIAIGSPVFCAPKSPYTTYVFLAQLQKLKGSDASWLNDHEPPAEEVEFSDDELERMVKSKKKNRKKFPNRPATEEDATFREDDDGAASQTRGKKRQHVNPMASGGNQNGQYNPNARPPFMPPMVPGFVPYGPPNYFNGYPHPGTGPWQAGPMHLRHGHPRHRGGRGQHRPRHHGPPIPGFPYQQNGPTHSAESMGWRPWCPPPQWDNQRFQNVNFGGSVPNPYRPPCAPPPPPPPQPPPPGQ